MGDSCTSLSLMCSVFEVLQIGVGFGDPQMYVFLWPDEALDNLEENGHSRHRGTLYI